jgi:hypothetical protein
LEFGNVDFYGGRKTGESQVKVLPVAYFNLIFKSDNEYYNTVDSTFYELISTNYDSFSQFIACVQLQLTSPHAGKTLYTYTRFASFVSSFEGHFA